jgi:hypothetical protein
LGNWGAGRKAQ